MARKKRWTHRKKSKKPKSSVQEAKLTECSRKANMASKSIGPISEIPLKNSEENEEIIDKDATFQHSTTASATESQIETSSGTIKRCIEDEKATAAKKTKVSDST
ncbi:hypothetical protein AVEN_154319-1 [Araneus ventricosus]|uniref:Uncharacterized protein n=1 Tax=Araneus ventricosus TaxID=182803 RepID=A0A4Y2S1M5_ARAVE|nr:hypothetical protein AVEN_154319-1 [Araneus ventricosus]